MNERRAWPGVFRWYTYGPADRCVGVWPLWADRPHLTIALWWGHLHIATPLRARPAGL